MGKFVVMQGRKEGALWLFSSSFKQIGSVPESMVLSVLLSLLAAAFGAEAGNHVIGCAGGKTIWQRNGWDGYMVQTIGVMALFTVEMAVNVIVVFFIMAHAQLVTLQIVGGLERMDQMVCVKQSEGAENVAFVYGWQLVFQLRQRKRAFGFCQNA